MIGISTKTTTCEFQCIPNIYLYMYVYIYHYIFNQSTQGKGIRILAKDLPKTYVLDIM